MTTVRTIREANLDPEFDAQALINADRRRAQGTKRNKRRGKRGRKKSRPKARKAVRPDDRHRPE